ncbi:MAG: PPOX class F420-dependent oxidoreductase [Proteobacteria bacterium]|nr:PPOX class F420-dependent oxidoreductase [Pseudomonadota bacterium]
MSSHRFDPGRETYVSLVTFRRDGREVRTPVWIAEADGRYYVFSEGDAGKVKRIRATKRVRLAACNYRGVVRGEWIDGLGRVVKERDVIERALASLRRKYGWRMKIGDVLSKLSGRYDKRAFLEIELAQATEA